MKLVHSICLLLGVVAVYSTEWDEDDNPVGFYKYYQYNLDKLATSGELQHMPWSDTYWPSYVGGISYRWNSPEPKPFEYELHKLDELKSMSKEDMKKLSPAEKYDIFMGRYDYPTVQAEWSRTSPEDQAWEGICHGWAPASLFYNQPDQVEMTNPDGITVPFGSSDVKALLSYWTAMYDTAQEDFIGSRCNDDLSAQPNKENNTRCIDMNAGAFHVILANHLNSTMNQGFVGDRDRSIQVWNQPIAKFKTTIQSIEDHPTIDGGKRAHVMTSMTYGKETTPQYEAHDTLLVTEQYEYFLDLDSSGNIIGGDHVTWDRLDFAWKKKIDDFSGYFASLDKVYQASIKTADISADYRVARKPIIPQNVLTASTGKFGVRMPAIPKGHKNSWSIQPEQGAKSISITFQEFGTVRHRDLVKIFEGANREGPLVAVLHGDELKQSTIVVNAGAAFIELQADTDMSQGFTATYAAL